jgi:hemolysin-activating ACP:hemolysin acyltransferase
MFDLKQMLELTSRGNHSRFLEAAAIGLFVVAKAELGGTSSGPLGWHLTRFRRAIELDQITFYFDHFGRYVGHAWWTQVPAYLEPQLINGGPDNLDVKDFSLKGNAWLIDFNAQLGALPDILLDIRDNAFRNCETLTYFRFKKNRRIVKRITRNSEASFFRASPKTTEISRHTLLIDRELFFFACTRMEKFIHLGMALMLLSQQPKFAQMPLSVVFHRIRRPMEFKQYQMHVSADNEPLSFFTWAWLEVTERIKLGFRPMHTLEAYEWNEGTQLFLCDAVAAPNGIGSVLRDLADAWHTGETLYLYPATDGSASASTITCFSSSDRLGLRHTLADLNEGADVIEQLTLQEKGAC